MGRAKETERRRSPRIPIRIQIEYETPEGFFQDYMRNLSLGGIFIETQRPLPVHTRLKVQFRLPDMNVPIMADGVVVHTLRVGRSKAPGGGMGIRFSDVDRHGRELLEEYLKRHGGPSS